VHGATHELKTSHASRYTEKGVVESITRNKEDYSLAFLWRLSNEKVRKKLPIKSSNGNILEKTENQRVCLSLELKGRKKTELGGWRKGVVSARLAVLEGKNLQPRINRHSPNPRFPPTKYFTTAIDEGGESIEEGGEGKSDLTGRQEGPGEPSHTNKAVNWGQGEGGQHRC